MFRTLNAALLAAAVSAASGSYNYKQNGADWGDLCANGKEQSPIDLTEAGATKNGKMSLTGFNYFDVNINSQLKSTDPTYTTYFHPQTLYE